MPITTKKPSTSSLMPTITALNQALSLMPTTKNAVRAVTMKTAGRLNTIGTPSTRGAALRISGVARAVRKSVASQRGNFRPKPRRNSQK